MGIVGGGVRVGGAGPVARSTQKKGSSKRSISIFFRFFMKTFRKTSNLFKTLLLREELLLWRSSRFAAKSKSSSGNEGSIESFRKVEFFEF